MPDNKNENKAVKDEEFQQKLREFELMFTAKLPEKLRELDQSLGQCLQETANKEHLVNLHRQLHTLAGSAGTFGFSELGLQARKLDEQINVLIPNEQVIQQVLEQVAEGLKKMIDWTKSGPRSDVASSPTKRQPRSADLGSARLIYLVDNDAALAASFSIQLANFGYRVAIFDSLQLLIAAVSEQRPAAVVMDLGLPAGRLAGAAEIRQLHQIEGPYFPVIFISTCSNFEARLAAVHAGADGYFAKPIDVMALIDRLDSVTVDEDAGPYRVLVIDDDVSIAEYYRTVLIDAGMEVTVLGALPEIFKALSEFRPELILMDVYMPKCNGIDLAKVIRQDNTYLDVPIVFLSSESNLSKQFDAMQSGADDFLTKPITADHLISSLSSRAERYRGLRGLITRDSLTGLYNHSAIKEHLSREFSRSQRADTSLSVALIDLDFFKDVNDTYGHQVGDQVIRTLARLLKQRLRRGDIIGRYGGEEFVVLMYATPPEVAFTVIEQIREVFSKIMHQAENHEFHITLSAGIAGIGELLDAESLLRAADEALYRAKHEGRNRVIA